MCHCMNSLSVPKGKRDTAKCNVVFVAAKNKFPALSPWGRGGVAVIRS